MLARISTRSFLKALFAEIQAHPTASVKSIAAAIESGYEE